MEAASEIRRFIQTELLFGDEARPITDDTPLCDGIIDSIGLLDLVAFLEAHFGIQIEEQDMTAQNFRTVDDISRLVQRVTQPTDGHDD